jgi:hypothetical protein
MVQWFLLDWIDAEAAGATVADELYLTIETLAHIAQTPLPLLQMTVARAQVALELAIGQLVPVTG